MSFYASLAQPFPTFYTKSHSTSIIFTACAHLQREERSVVITFLESVNTDRKKKKTTQEFWQVEKRRTCSDFSSELLGVSDVSFTK